MGILSVVRKELQEVVHDRAMMAVLLVFPVVIMFFMGTYFRSLEISGLPIGVSGQLNTTTSETLLSGLNESSAFKLVSYDSEEEAMTAFRNGQLRAVIVVPEDFEQTLTRGKGATIIIVVDNSDLALEQSILAAMGSVVQASSANITRGYVSGAWIQLQQLNGTASALAESVAESRAKMEGTKVTLAGIRQDIDNISIGSLESSIEDSAASVASLQGLIEVQKASLANLSASNELLLSDSRAFLINASFALNESIDTVGSTHERLVGQSAELNSTITTLDASIAGLEAIKATTTDGSIISALDLNIAALGSLRNTTVQQRDDTDDQIRDLERLNETLHDFKSSLEDYSDQLDQAQEGSAGLSGMEDVLDNVSATLSGLNESFGSARGEVGKLKSLLGEMKNTSSEIEETLDSALNQTASVDSLIKSLQDTVQEQTGRDPKLIASPLSVDIKPQYEGGSFVDFIMPQIVAVSLLLSCFLLGSISVVREKTRFTIVRSLMAPGALESLIVGKIMTLVLLSFGQILLIVIVGMALYGVKMPTNVPMLVAGGLVSSLVLTSIGVLIGLGSKRESAAIQTCLLIAIPMLFLGNIIFSPDLLPQYTQVLQQFLPMAHVTSIFKIVLITNGNPTASMIALLTYFVLTAGVLLFMVIRRREISNYI